MSIGHLRKEELVIFVLDLIGKDFDITSSVASGKDGAYLLLYGLYGHGRVIIIIIIITIIIRDDIVVLVNFVNLLPCMYPLMTESLRTQI